MNDTIQTYEEWLAARRYSVVRHRNPRQGKRTENVVATGLSLTFARQMAERMQATEWASSPGETSWTIDRFSIQLDNPWVPVHRQLANQKG